MNKREGRRAAEAADAVLSYRFDPESGEHVLRLLDLVAERALRPSRKAG